jgi:hypothetical protein
MFHCCLLLLRCQQGTREKSEEELALNQIARGQEAELAQLCEQDDALALAIFSLVESKLNFWKCKGC